MKHLFTPILVKDQPDFTPPADQSAYYLVTSNGLFLCRRHELFSSCVAARQWPRELAPQKEQVELHLPPLPRPLVERIVGFFARIRELHGSEAAVLLYWDLKKKCYEVVVPPQTAILERGWKGHLHPTGVRYETPVHASHASPDLVLAGDVHSHVDSAAYASHTDVDDEEFRTGLHIVVGRLQKEPPDVYAAMVVDGRRFDVHPDLVFAGYTARDLAIPGGWIDLVEVEVQDRWTEPPMADGTPGVSLADGQSSREDSEGGAA